MGTRIGSVVWGVRDVPRAIAFWTAVLEYELREEPDDDWAVLVPEHGDGPQLAIALVETAPNGRRRHHLDLYATDRASEVERIVGLGATRVEWRYEDDADYIVLADPDGNLFDVIQAP
ncbi:VOC family protein [Agromyces sp. NPDC058110]|uniref:VOC family protein n=1 Tax=Agromyces sp. NPDC058110 TaxID=3346345 RepID=UPI0036DDD2A6